MLLLEAGRGRIGQPEAMLYEETSADVLRAVALTGRGHWQAVDGPVLKLAAPVTGKCDPLETGLGAREAGLLAMAPALTPQSVDTLDKGGAGTLAEPRPALAVAHRAPPGRIRVSHPLSAPTKQGPERGHRGPLLGGVKPEPSWSHSAILTFGYGPSGTVDPRDRKETLECVEQGVLLESGRDLAGESAAIQTLEGLGLIRSLGEEDDTGLCFELPDDGAWLGFMGRDVPRLAEQGWQIYAEDGFHFRVAHLGDDWRIEITESEGQHWFDLGLGVEVDGEHLDLLPLLVDLVQRYQADFSLPMLAQMQDEETLQVRLDDGRLILMPAGRLRSILSTLIELYDPQRPLTDDGRLRLSGLQATQLAQIEEADPRLIFQGGEASRAWGGGSRNSRALRSWTRRRDLQPSYGPINARVWIGSSSCGNTTSAVSSPTIWAWARRCRPWRIS